MQIEEQVQAGEPVQVEEQMQIEDRVQVEEQVRVEERMQVEGQDVEDQYENENIIPNDVQNNEESNTGSKSSQRSMYYTSTNRIVAV